MRRPPISESIRTTIAIQLSMRGRATRREFGGYDVGVRRKLAVVPFIAADMARAVLRGLNFQTGNSPAGVTDVANVIKQALLSVSDQDAFALVKADADLMDEAREAIALVVLQGLSDAFSITEKEADTKMVAVGFNNGWKMWEVVSNRELNYKWRHSWKEKDGADFVAFDGDVQIGRIFQVPVHAREIWFWIVATRGGNKLNWPHAGVEQTPYLASRRLEMIYESIISGKTRTGN